MEFEQQEFDEKDEFERELRQAFERRPAPSRLKRQVMEEVRKRHAPKQHFPAMWLQRLAAGVVLAAVVSGTFVWRRQLDERRRGEEARRQVLTAFRITGHALNEMNSRLAAHDRGQ